MAQLVEWLADLFQYCRQLVSSLIARRSGTQDFQRGLRFVDATLHFGLAYRQRRAANFIEQAFELAAAEAYAEELGGEIGNLVRFIENDRFRSGQEFDEALLLHGEIGKQQVMVDDDEIRLLGGTTRVDDMTFLVLGTFGAEAVLGRGGNQRPDGRVFRNVGQLGAITGRRPIPPFANDFQVRGV